MNTVLLVDVPSGVNVPTDNRPRLQANGPDTTIYIDYWAKGAGSHVFRGWDGASHAGYFFSESADADAFVGIHGAVGVAKVRAVGQGTNYPLRLEPQGSAPVQVKNAVQLVTIAQDGTVTTIGFIGEHKAIFGGTSTDLAIRAEPGRKIRFFIGGTEVESFE